MKNFTAPYFQLKSSVKNDGLFWIVWADAILIFYFEGIFKWHFQKDCSIFCRIKNANPSYVDIQGLCWYDKKMCHQQSKHAAATVGAEPTISSQG